MDGKRIWERLEKDGTNPQQPIAHLFALHDLRLVGAHLAKDKQKDVMKALERFGITPGEEAPGYGKILDTVYDKLRVQLIDSGSKVRLGR